MEFKSMPEANIYPAQIRKKRNPIIILPRRNVKYFYELWLEF